MAQKQAKALHSPADFFAIRSPLLPLSRYFDWEKSISGTLQSATYEERAQAIQEHLFLAIDQPIVREAIFLASPSLYRGWMALAESPKTVSDASQRVVRSLMSYFARMTYRATPFGLFAGHGTGHWSSTTEIFFPDKSTNRRRTQLDNAFVANLGKTIQANEALWGTIQWWSNSSIYTVQGGYKYIRQTMNGETLEYSLVFMEGSAFIAALLECSRNGASLADLAEVLVDTDDEAEVTTEEAISFVGELIRAQVLEARMVPICIGPAPFESFIQHLPAHEITDSTIKTLRAIAVALSDLDTTGLGIDTQQYTDIQQCFVDFPVQPSLDRLFQVDMFIQSKDIVLGQRVKRELTNTVRLFQQFSPPHANPLSQFIRDFKQKFGTASIPLMQALDQEEGVPFTSDTNSSISSPLLKDLSFSNHSNRTLNLSKREQWFLNKIREGHTEELVLSKQDLLEIGTSSPTELPDSFSLIATLCAPSSEALDSGEFLILPKGITSPSGASLLGRFCYGDEPLKHKVQNFIRAEEQIQPNVVFAEVVHLPEGRMANVIARPDFRKHEISFLGKSSSGAQQIPISDLMVRVEQEQIVLFSRVTGQRIVPRISNAYSLFTGVHVYQFLAQLQTQEATGQSFAWGDIVQFTKKLPRVRSGRIILARAQWRLDRAEITKLGSGTAKQRFAYAKILRQTLDLPRLVEFVDFDNRLLIDFENPLSIDTWSHRIQVCQECVIVEVLCTPDALIAQGPDGHYTHEAVIPFSKTPGNGSVISAMPHHQQIVDTHQLQYMPGEEWLYLKIYTTQRFTDTLLVEHLGPQLHQWLNNSTIDHWFFLRYADPEHHMRIRLHGDPRILLNVVLPELHALLNELTTLRLIHSISLGTYAPEYSRYGGIHAMPIVEQMFWADSEAVLCIGELQGDSGEDARWKLCLRGLDQLLNDFHYNLDSKRDMMSDLRNGYRQEFSASTPLTKRIGTRFRNDASSILELLDPANDAASVLHPGIEAFHRRSTSMQPLIEKLTQMKQKGKVNCGMDNIVRSLLHMHTNRLMVTRGREHELVLYDYLFRTYDTQRHRKS